MLGSPIAHSRSPQLHLAAYRALGLTDWTYDRIECTAEQLPALVGGFGPEWVGVSVTMPGKFAALRVRRRAHRPRAELVGSANTLVRTDDGLARRQHRRRRRDGRAGRGCPGSGDGARFRRHRAGGGGRAGRAGRRNVTVVARNPDKAAPAGRARRPARASAHGSASLDAAAGRDVAGVDVVVNTVPADAVAPYARRVGARRRCCSTRSTTRGPPRWRRRSQAGGRTGDQRAADAAEPGVRPGRAVHRAARRPKKR